MTRFTRVLSASALVFALIIPSAFAAEKAAPTAADKSAEAATDKKDTPAEKDAASAEKKADPAADKIAIPAQEPVKPADSGSKGPWLLGDFGIGASARVSIPHPLVFGLDMKYGRYLGASLEYGSFTLPIELNDTEIGIKNLGAVVRFFPFAGSFFLGANFGQQTITGTTAKDIEAGGQTIETNPELKIKTLFATPTLGWYSVWDFGLVMGFEIGAQLPLSSSSELTPNIKSENDAVKDAVEASDDYKAIKANIEKAGDTIGKSPLPMVTVFRLGWMF